MKEFSFNTFSELYQTCISQLNPAETILIYKDNKITVNEFMHTVQSFTRCFHEIGIKKGSRVGINLPDCPEILSLFIALSLSGACAIPMHRQLPVADKVSMLRKCDADAVISDSNDLAGFKAAMKKDGYAGCVITLEKNDESDYSLFEIMPSVSDREYTVILPGPDDPVMVLPSTGTSGLPKFVEMTQRNAVNMVKVVRYLYEPLDDLKNGYTMLSAFPMTGIPTITIISVFFLGITTVILDDFSPLQFLSLIEKWKVDLIAATPAYYEILMHLPLIKKYKTDSVKRIYSGMDFFPNKRLLKMKEFFKNLEIAGIGYGLTETSSIVMVWKAYKEKDFFIPTNCMTPVPGIGNEMEIINANSEKAEIGEQGEIIIKGPNVVREYYKNPLETEKAFRKDGWLYTGDLGCMDEDGRIHLLGRLKNIIKRGGRSVSPIVINNYLLKYQGIHDSTVVGVPHTMFGEMIWAFVIKGKDQDIKKGDLMKYCRNGLPPYMVPDHISFIEKIPRKPGIGKIDSGELINFALDELTKMSGGSNE